MADTGDTTTEESKIESPAAETDETKPAETSEGETGSDDGSESDDEDAEETAEAKRLFKALKGPDGVRILKILAQDAGLLTAETKTEQKKAKNLILDAFEESLGDDYKFLAPKLSGAFEKILQAHEEKVESRFTSLKQAEIEREADDAINSMMKNPDFKIHHNAILKLMDEFPANPAKVPQKEYLQKLLKLAKAEANEKGSSKAGKASKNANDASVRLRDSSVGGDEKKFTSDRPITRRQAIAETIEELEASAK